MIRRRIIRWCGCLCAILFIVPAQLTAQDTTTASGSGWLVGGSIGVPRTEGRTEAVLSVLAVHGTQIRPNRLGGDVAVGIVPRLLIEGAVAVGVRGGVALPFVLSPKMILLPAAGVSLIAVAGSGGSGATVGYHFGASAVLRTGKQFGLRPGVMLHRFGDSGNGTVALIELGFVRIP